jgi:DNA-binding MarR family transcriptional regulator
MASGLENRANELGLIIRDIMRRFQSIHQEIACGPHSQLTHQELFLLEYLGEGGPQKMRSAADYLRVAVNSLTAIVDNMEQKGLVRRTRSQVDRRVIHIELTGEGRQSYQGAMAVKNQFHCQLLSSLSATEQRTLIELFRKISSGGTKPAGKLATPVS